ncbi:MAG TPA: TlyA family RNA methyltransferase [Candidatus Saccharimonadales bacterium]|nr:TlyA family RNA methyltransferase [Candidatus Saccharimonadales bacterium]
MKQRLDQLLFSRGLVPSRSQAESWIRLGKVYVAGKQTTKPGAMVDTEQDVELKADEQYVSRAGLKLASVAKILHLEFANKVMLDVGSSTGGFTDYALKHGIRKVIAVDVGTNQLHPSLHGDPRIELHEQTDIRNVILAQGAGALREPTRSSEALATQPAESELVGGSRVIIEVPDLVVIDVSFISLRDILPHVATLCGPHTIVAAMVKPQFEARESNLKHKGVIKNDRMRRDILKDFEQWVTRYFVVLDKADSDVAGSKGNRERFYKLRRTA